MSSSFRTGSLGLALLASLVACGGDPTAPGDRLDIIADPEVLTLMVGERETIPGTGRTVTFVAVPNDWRCPKDAACISEGSFGIVLGIDNIETTPAIGVPALTMELFGHEPKVLDGMSFEVVSLSPEPTLEQHPTRESYVLVLRIAPAP